MTGASLPRGAPAALQRIAALAPLDESALQALHKAIDDTSQLPARRELVSEGREIGGRRLILSGWAARVRLIPDGRRQLISFVLPGELLGNCGHARPVALSNVIALTNVTYCALPEAAPSQPLREAYEVSRAMEEAHLLAQITRLGRLTALERTADLLLELYERLALCGLAEGGRFALPLTQEIMADALGLTSVHLSRTLQLARRNGDFEWREGQVVLHDLEALTQMVGRVPVQVSCH